MPLISIDKRRAGWGVFRRSLLYSKMLDGGEEEMSNQYAYSQIV